MLFLHSNRGQTLIEVILVTFLFGVIGTGLVATLLSSSVVSSRGVEHLVASGYIQEALAAVRSIRSRDWSELTNGTHGLSTTGGMYDFSGTSDSLDSGRFTRTITVEDAYRTGMLTGNLAASGVLDAATKKITVNVTWEVSAGLVKNIDAVFYAYNWDQESWVQTLTTDFENGRENSTDITTTVNGEVRLRAHNANWSNIESHYRFGLVGGGDRKAIHADPDTGALYVLADADIGSEFHALDISDVSDNQPTVIATYECSTCNEFAIHKGYAYIVANESGPGAEVIILEVPSLSAVATINLPGSASANGVDIEGNTLVVVRSQDNAEEEIVFYNISNPASPVYLGGASTAYLLDSVAYNGSYAFASGFDDTNELTVIRQSDYSIVDTLDLSGSADTDGIAWFGNFVYVGKSANASGGELYKIDASDPLNISVTSQLEVGDSVNDIQVDANGQYLVAATRFDSKNFFVADMATFTEANSGDLYGGTQAESASVFGGHGYAGTTTSGSDIEVFRVSPGGWSNAQLVGSADLSGNHDESSIVISGNYAYQATENNGSNHDFFIYDISTPSSPTYLSSLDTNSDVNDLVVNGNFVYLATKANAQEVIVIDTTTKTSPQIVGSYDASGSADGLSLALLGTTLYLGRIDSSSPEFYVLNISAPSTPLFVGSTDFSSDLERMVASGSYVYAATESNSAELTVFDVVNPALPVYAAGLDLADSEDGQAIALFGTTLALGREDDSDVNELAIINISTPTVPVLLGSADIGDEVSGIGMENASFVHLATDVSGQQYQRWDITTPASPQLDASFNLLADGEGIMFNGVNVFVASEDNASELKIIGPGSLPSGYAREGTFTSQPFDAGANASWDSIEWTSSGTGTISFRIRTADTQANLATARWVGSDGTTSTSYTTWGQGIVEDPNATGRRWFEWKALLQGDGSSTPSLEDVTIRYSQ